MAVCPGVYVIECLPLSQVYVGSGMNWRLRVQRHHKQLNKGAHSNRKLQWAWNKYGPNAFKFSLLEACEDHIQLQKVELKWIRKLHAVECGFNIYPGVPGGYFKHGMTHTRTHKSWDAMLQRCTNQNDPSYSRYGGNGIGVCKRWSNFENFLADMGERPEGTTLDRYPDNSGNYSPENCRWATWEQQVHNKKNRLFITHEGITKPLIAWADEKGMPRDLLRKRYHAGMVGNELFSSSYSRYQGDGNGVKRKRVETRYNLHKYEYQGRLCTIADLVELTGIPRWKLNQRLLRDKMPLTKALSSTPLKRGKKAPYVSLKPKRIRPKLIQELPQA